MNWLELTPMVWTHLGYLTLAGLVTLYVGRVLRKQGLVVATTGEETEPTLVDAFSRLLTVGFYLLAFGVTNLALRSRHIVTDLQGVIEVVSSKFGTVLLILGILHLAMTLGFTKIRYRNRDEWSSGQTAVR